MLYSGYTLLDCNDNVPENACIFEAVTSTLRTNSSVYISQAKFIWAFDRLVRIELGWLESAHKERVFQDHTIPIHAENQVGLTGICHKGRVFERLFEDCHIPTLKTLSLRFRL